MQHFNANDQTRTETDPSLTFNIDFEIFLHIQLGMSFQSK